jgi:hypothetical protein
MLTKYPSVSLTALEPSKREEDLQAFREFMARVGQQHVGFPTTLIGNQIFIGFSNDVGFAMENSIRTQTGLPPLPEPEGLVAEAPGVETVELPFFGRVNMSASTEGSRWSLPVFTLVIAGLDSFNPCALFVLLFLLSLLVHARSRARMALVGGTFVLVSGLVYFAFMAAWLNLFFVIGHIGWITTAAGVLAVAAGALNVKDFFAFKQGVSLSMSGETQHKLIGRMRGLLRAESLGAMMTGALVLAAAANAYELLCTAGFPMLYTRVLTLNKLTQGQYYLYLGLYNLVYVIPLAVVVGIFTATLGGRKLTETQGRTLKLLSGVMMLTLGLVLVARPELLNNPVAGAAMLGGSVAVTIVLRLVFRGR